jgi:hypothetical protein
MKALADITERSAGSEDDFKMMLADLNVLTGRIERGEGTLGRILSDERAAEPEEMLAIANAAAPASDGSSTNYNPRPRR